MASYALRSRLDEEPETKHRLASMWRLMKWIRPSAPDKPMSEMTEEEFEKVPLI